MEDDLGMNKLLDEIQSLENIGIDTSFISDVRKLYDLESPGNSSQVSCCFISLSGITHFKTLSLDALSRLSFP